MTIYAAAGAPKDGVMLASGSAIVAYHTFASDGADNPGGDDYQAAAEEQYRLATGGAWTSTGVTVGGSSSVVYPALSAGNYERQVRVQSNNTGTWSAWSSSGFFSVVTLNAAPVFTAPGSGSSQPNVTVTATWTSTPAQKGYEIQVWSGPGGTGSLDWSESKTSSTKSALVSLPMNGGVRYIRLRYTDTTGVLSQWGERQITVTWVAPAVPSVVASPSDPGSLGMLHALAITATHPTPTGGQPTVTSMDVFARPLGDTSAGVLVLAAQAPAGVKEWAAPAARRYQVRVLAKATDGRTVYSAWTTATADNTVLGVLLAAANNIAGTRRAYRHNDTEATDAWSGDTALTEYAGRTFPVAEFGDAESRVLTVPVLHSRGVTAGDAAALVALLRRKGAVLYRDRRGRKMYGVLEVTDVQDTFYGHVTSLKVTAIDWPADREMS